MYIWLGRGQRQGKKDGAGRHHCRTQTIIYPLISQAIFLDQVYLAWLLILFEICTFFHLAHGLDGIVGSESRDSPSPNTSKTIYLL